ncbi:MAG: 50S ribosomal protein L33 [bacterium]|nr:50S ribosomal protein L33 [bacterium]
MQQQSDTGMVSNRDIIALACTKCKRKNYTLTKNKKTHQGKLELTKYCPWDRERTVHREAKP